MRITVWRFYLAEYIWDYEDYDLNELYNMTKFNFFAKNMCNYVKQTQIDADIPPQYVGCNLEAII